EVNIPADANLLGGISSRLTKLTCIFPLKSSYPISRFLSNQPAIEELYIDCHRSNLSPLEPGAFPVLKNLNAPLRLLSRLLVCRLPFLYRLCVLDVMRCEIELMALGLGFLFVGLSEPLELVIWVDVDSGIRHATLLRALGLLGRAATCVASLRLNICGDRIGQEELQDITSTLSSFSNLQTSAITFHPINSEICVSIL
ncbi:unnamed protein product, partial [Rhizoctonia solani]